MVSYPQALLLLPRIKRKQELGGGEWRARIAPRSHPHLHNFSPPEHTQSPRTLPRILAGSRVAGRDPLFQDYRLAQTHLRWERHGISDDLTWIPGTQEALPYPSLTQDLGIGINCRPPPFLFPTTLNRFAPPPNPHHGVWARHPKTGRGRRNPNPVSPEALSLPRIGARTSAERGCATVFNTHRR